MRDPEKSDAAVEGDAASSRQVTTRDDWGVEFGDITLHDGPWRRGGDRGQIYVVEFDSGWVKVGHSTVWTNRRSQLDSEFGSRYGWAVERDWQSGSFSAIASARGARPALKELEIQVLRFIRSIPGVQVFSDELPDRGRGVCGIGETETFRGRSFGDLVACADVLARCSPTE
ncbi:hypothetical protein LRS71_24480 [Rhodococcus pyridinivorans]|uniref:hypothetical protein n=1 Tax=Rhodococcus pyridinivorans TaxID=103816 RepID=UPI001E462382|nr:hypothetical protein [Rhodococcus pyridinivorans]MCD5422671.1 hypothetical protein [Rhodococcus pyridinivorans]